MQAFHFDHWHDILFSWCPVLPLSACLGSCFASLCGLYIWLWEEYPIPAMDIIDFLFSPFTVLLFQFWVLSSLLITQKNEENRENMIVFPVLIEKYRKCIFKEEIIFEKQQNYGFWVVKSYSFQKQELKKLLAEWSSGSLTFVQYLLPLSWS